jgi:hypothetical protein
MVFKVQPSEFWAMTPGEWWVLYDMHREQMGAIRNAGRQGLSKSEAQEMKRELDEIVKKERREHGIRGKG